MLYPVANTFDFGYPLQSWEVRAEGAGWRIECSKTIVLASYIEGWLRDLRALPRCRQIEIGFSGTIIVQATVKTCALKFLDIVGEIIWLYPGGQWAWCWAMQTSSWVERSP